MIRIIDGNIYLVHGYRNGILFLHMHRWVFALSNLHILFIWTHHISKSLFLVDHIHMHIMLACIIYIIYGMCACLCECILLISFVQERKLCCAFVKGKEEIICSVQVHGLILGYMSFTNVFMVHVVYLTRMGSITIWGFIYCN